MKLFGISVLALVLSMTSAHAAAWITTVEDDVFTGGKAALMTSDPNEEWTVYGYCVEGGEAEFAVLEANTTLDVLSDDPTARMIIKPDRGEKFDNKGVFYRHNDQAVGVKIVDLADIEKALKSLISAKKTISVGLEIASSNYRRTVSISAAGSSDAVNLFITTCKIAD